MTAAAIASSERSNWPLLRNRMRTCATWYFSAPTMICAIASTTFVGCLPEAVSADSITASVPSMTALATSDTSARVGMVLVIIDSIICVAVITTLFCDAPPG